MKECKNLKWLLILQSFLPLFFLVIIRYYSEVRIKLVYNFVSEVFRGNFMIFETALNHSELYATSLLCFCFVLLIFGFLIYVFFKKIQSFGFQEEEKRLSLILMGQRIVLLFLLHTLRRWFWTTLMKAKAFSVLLLS